MMKAFITAILMAMLGQIGWGNEAFDQANRNFENGKYGQAVEAYEELLKDGPRVSVLNNLGSAYFRMGEKGRAILAFERALILDPGDPDLLANLELAQEQAAVYPELLSNGWQGFLAKVSPNSRALIALVAALVLPLTAFIMIRFRGRARWALVILLLSMVVLKIALRSIEDQADPASRAVVLAAPATVRLSPFETADSRGTLSSGREVVLGQLENGYFWIEGGSGATQGWVHEDEVAPVIPDEERGLAVPEG